MHFTTEIPFNIEQYATYAHVSPLRLNLSFDVHTFGIVMDSHNELCEMLFTLKGIFYIFYFSK